MKIKRVDEEVLKKFTEPGYGNTVFTTYPWIQFLKKNQNAEPVILELSVNEEIVGYFVGLIVKKMGVKILGSPFEGWLTPDMGFIRLAEFDVNDALKSVAKYAFKELKCWYVQITDKAISVNMLDPSIKHTSARVLHIDTSLNQDDILQGFTRNGRRDVRAFYRKGARVKKVPFDKSFADLYYKQLIDVFDKQNLKPSYSKEKVYDLVRAFDNYPDLVVALEAIDEDENCIATVMSFGFGTWAYYLGAASLRMFQKLLPNEGLFWEFVKHWNENGISNLDLVGYREYKMKYNPTIIEVPVVYFERICGLVKIKSVLKKVILVLRKVKGK